MRSPILPGKLPNFATHFVALRKKTLAGHLAHSGLFSCAPRDSSKFESLFPRAAFLARLAAHLILKPAKKPRPTRGFFRSVTRVAFNSGITAKKKTHRGLFCFPDLLQICF